MDTASALAMGMASRGQTPKVFDWIKAVNLILKRLEQGTDFEASAGLVEDWEWTSGPIFRDGAPIPREQTYTHLSSTWATPEICIDGEFIECYLMEDQLGDFEWGAETYWPEEVPAVLRLSPFSVV